LAKGQAQEGRASDRRRMMMQMCEDMRERGGEKNLVGTFV